MGLEQKLMEDMKSAMKAKEQLRLETIRGVRAQLKNAELSKGGSLTEEEVIEVLLSAAKKRKEAIEQYRLGGREDRAGVEAQELAIIETYLPAQMGAEEIARLVDEVIREVNAASAKDMGKVMGAVMPKVKGKADGKIVQQIVREKLAAL
ncbi:MAG: GatB/YqeY domain-containing protein [Calditrichaceae bacterium]|nr:GatB/YqeY domain-containing protein [Calditrichia bacterium]NUQ42029.1 GatB/YqeY domain-containing protein [Calditrichaceae bacterium]